MKINPGWIFMMILLVIACIFTSSLIICLIYQIDKTKDVISVVISFIVLISLIDIACLSLMIMEIFHENAFYKEFFISKDRFKIDIYNNLHVWSIDNHAYIYTYNRDKLLNLEKIKCVQYYNIKKKEVLYKILPYESFQN